MPSVVDIKYSKRYKAFFINLSEDEKEFIGEMIRATSNSLSFVPQSKEQEDTIFIDELFLLGVTVWQHSKERKIFLERKKHKELLEKVKSADGAILLNDMYKLKDFYDEDPIELSWYALKILVIDFALDHFKCRINFKEDIPF